MASSTGDGSSDPELQADPVDTATPARSSATSSVSPSQPSKATFSVFDTRGVSAPAMRAPGIRRATPSSRSRSAASRSISEPSAAAARSSASPSPTMAATFSVPARRPRSWWPPTCTGASCRPRRTHKRPAPFGPPILWAEQESKSMGSCRTRTGIFPTACTASVWNGTRCRRHSSPMRSSGNSTPVSLFAAIAEQRLAPGSAASSAARSSLPSPSTGIRMTSTPERSSSAQAPSTAGCSTAVVTTFLRARPRSASASDSVPPEVKTSSRGSQSSAVPHCSRARSTRLRASCPGLCTDDGFANTSRSAGIMADMTAGSRGVVALASR